MNRYLNFNNNYQKKFININRYKKNSIMNLKNFRLK